MAATLADVSSSEPSLNFSNNCPSSPIKIELISVFPDRVSKLVLILTKPFLPAKLSSTYSVYSSVKSPLRKLFIVNLGIVARVLFSSSENVLSVFKILRSITITIKVINIRVISLFRALL